MKFWFYESTSAVSNAKKKTLRAIFSFCKWKGNDSIYVCSVQCVCAVCEHEQCSVLMQHEPNTHTHAHNVGISMYIYYIEYLLIDTDFALPFRNYFHFIVAILWMHSFMHEYNKLLCTSGVWGMRYHCCMACVAYSLPNVDSCSCRRTMTEN